MSSSKDISELIKSSTAAWQSQKTQPSKEKKILKSIRKLKIDSIDLTTRLNAAQWLMMYHSMSILHANNRKQELASLKNAKLDMPLAWNLLDCQFPPIQNITALLLRADVSQRMSDFPKLSQVFKEIDALPNSLPQIQLIAVSLAPTLGD